VAAIAGSGMSNEDLYMLRQLVTGLGGSRLGAWPPTHGGADIVAKVGVGKGTNLGKLTKGDAVLVISSDLEEEAPIWRLRIKEAQKRGAYVVVANARPTRMDSFASQSLRYDSGKAAETLTDLRKNSGEIAQKLADAANLVIIAGAEGLTLEGSRALMQAAANFLIETGHTGKPNNGLIGAFPGANGMGLHYLGFMPEASLDIAQNPPKVLIIAQADVLADDPTAAAWLDKVDTIINLNLFLDGAGEKSSIVLPIQSFAERDGSFVNGERRVQRFYTAQGPIGDALPAWQALSRLSERLGQGRAKLSAAAVMSEAAKNVPAFNGASYSEISRVVRQFPDVGGADLYYGGTSYKNNGGLGVQIQTGADKGESVSAGEVKLTAAPKVAKGKLLIVPTTRLYNQERTFKPSALMRPRVVLPTIELNADDAKTIGIQNGDVVEVSTESNVKIRVRAHVNGAAPAGTALLPRHLSAEATPLVISVGQVSKVEG
jgi:NADH-quinone oxidoreductase subunit G